MDTETLTVNQKGEDFEIIVQHDQSGSAYGITLSKNAYEQLRQHFVITPLLTDKEIEEYIWEEIPISLSQIDIDTHSDSYVRYLNAVHWAKWGRDNCNGL